ncbi:hypothetical protein QQ045_021923 [Rhodiola kirilowii]
MAYRRRQGITRTSTFKEETYHNNNHNDDGMMWPLSSNSPPSLAAQAIRASAHNRPPPSAELNPYDLGMHEDPSKSGFWGVLARKAKLILDDDDQDQDASSIRIRSTPSLQITDSRKIENPRLRKGLDVLATSLNHIGDTFERALEEGRTKLESKTADIIQETRKLQTRRKKDNSVSPSQSPLWQPLNPTPPNHQADQIKASRDVAMATAAKAKLLLRELKTAKADLVFAKERCRQLEEENKVLRESREKGAYPADDDLIRHQLETLLAEKARLAHENSVYARENHFLREIVEYHQLTMQDVVYLDEGIEEVTEVYPIPGYPSVLSMSGSPSQTPPRTSLSEMFSTLDPPLSTKRDLHPDRLLDGTMRTKSVGEESLLRRDPSGNQLKRLDILLVEDGQMRRDASRKDLGRLSASSSTS